jgi:hypothetical protein
VWQTQGDELLSQGDGWPSQGDGWLSEGDGWLSQGDMWLTSGRWVAKLLVRLPATAAALWVRIQTSPKKNKKDDTSKGVANILYPANKILKK